MTDQVKTAPEEKGKKTRGWRGLWKWRFVIYGGLLILAAIVVRDQWQLHRAIRAAELLRSHEVALGDSSSAPGGWTVQIPFSDWHIPLPSFAAWNPDLDVEWVSDSERILGSQIEYRTLLAFPKLNYVELEPQQVTDELVDVLEQCRSLKRLSLKKSELTDGDLKKLARLNRLTSLELGELRISNEGLKSLAGLKKLVTLDLHALEFQGTTDFEPIAKTLPLQELTLMGEGFGDPQIESVVKAFQETPLRNLSLSTSALSDVSVRGLAELKNLKSLTLGDMKIRDEGLMVIAKMKSLQKLDLSFAQISATGVLSFKKARPDVELSIGEWLRRKM